MSDQAHPLTDAEQQKYRVGGSLNTKSAREELRAVDYWLTKGVVPEFGEAARFVRSVVRSILADRENERKERLATENTYLRRGLQDLIFFIVGCSEIHDETQQWIILRDLVEERVQSILDGTWEPS